MTLTDPQNARATTIRPMSCIVAIFVTLFVVSSPLDSAVSAATVEISRSESSERTVVRLFGLSAVRRSFDALARDATTMRDGERTGWADFCRLVEAVVGTSPVGPFTFDELVGAASGGPALEVFAARGVATRNRMAYDMQAVGYSAREAADVVSGRITLEALVTSRLMIATGHGRDRAADYLHAQYARVAALKHRARLRSRARQAARRGEFDGLIRRHATAHGVEPAIVHAIIAAESAFDPAARSRVGAIGLMQLMPATAQELRVDPYVPGQNIEGGVRYFSQQLERFGDIRLALVAYNAGPAFAERYVRGQATLYEETRGYVERVLAGLDAPH